MTKLEKEAKLRAGKKKKKKMKYSIIYILVY